MFKLILNHIPKTSPICSRLSQIFRILCGSLIVLSFLPVLPAPERVEFESAAKRNHQQQTAHQTADQGGRDDFPGDGGQAVPLVAAIQAVLLAIAAPRLKDAQIGAAMEVSRLAVVAVLFVRAF